MRYYVPRNHLFLRLIHQHSHDYVQHTRTYRASQRSFRGPQNKDQNGALNHSNPHHLLHIYSHTATVLSAILCQSSICVTSAGPVFGMLATPTTVLNVYG